jgi:23S rRNA (cytosine1962-C5)-methyltransferase
MARLLIMEIGQSSSGWVERARALRERVVDLSDTTVFRILNGEGDGVPGMFVDRFGDYGVSREPRDQDANRRKKIYAALMKSWGLRGIYEKDRATRGFHPGKTPENRPFIGDDAPEEITVRENGMMLLARLREGARPGVYPDQRENRLHLVPLLKNSRVLNTFSYTGAFSVRAALSGAKETVSVDLSKRALEWSKNNFAANGFDPSAHRHVKADTFDYLGLARRKGLRFDIVILDPPSFSTSRRNVFRAKRDWPLLIAAALKVLEPNGRLAISCNTHEINKRDILGMVAAGLGGKNRRAVEPEIVLGHPADFPSSRSGREKDTLQFIITRPIAQNRV